MRKLQYRSTVRTTKMTIQRTTTNHRKLATSGMGAGADDSDVDSAAVFQGGEGFTVFACTMGLLERLFSE